MRKNTSAKIWRELQDTWEAIRVAQREKKKGTLKTLRSLADLMR